MRGLGRDALHLAVLSAFAIAQPLLDLLGKYPAFFAAHDMARSEVVAFGLVLVLGPLLLLLVIELVAALGGERVRRRVHLLLIGALAALLVLQIVRRSSMPTGAVFAVSVAVAVALTAVYARAEGMRTFLSYLGPAPVVFLLLFLLTSSTSKLVLGGSAKAWDAQSSFRPPIVVVMFDAFPGLELQTPDHRVDAVRYPNLARLAREGAWYRNASNVHENTVFSVPSILDGRFPKKGQLPVVQDHPNSLFTLLGSTYDMNVAEEATNMCPPGLCHKTNQKSFRHRMSQLWSDTRIVYEYLALPKSYRADLPQITDRWAGFNEKESGAPGRTQKRGAANVIARLRSGRVGRWRRFLDGIRPGARPQLNFAHVFFPHEPRQYLPDGRIYQAGKEPDPSLEGPPSYDNQFLTDQGLQRNLLQVGFTDRLVGELIDRLKDQGIYDQTMIVLVSDHGESYDVDPKPAPPFVPGKLGFRRAVTKENIEDIASIVMFVKYPKGHGPRGTDKRYVRDVDLLPTIAQVLGIRMPFKVDGTSLLERGYRGHDDVRVETTSDGTVSMGVAEWQARREQSLQRRLELFGWGDEPPGLYGGIGPRTDLLGKRVADLGVAGAAGLTATIEEPGRFTNVNPQAFFCPCQIAGRLRGGSPAGHDIVVALNGEIAATGRSFGDLGANKLNWSVMLPERQLRAGRNSVEVFEVTGSTLRRIGRAP
jgi:hypothetical protein